ncbi:sodium:solute symporter family protein [Paraburkholderia caballeronis]|uniref:Solute:Na+ symporter, SSS family n=1 Tax=Paraburkholderia caballeronis TaxID=416943 RepID=A0A1H7VY99_9BURK|nr:sodium:solute symporter [Paraburkholderia caballeronis]PXW14623.1 SSS family solute:Na+ symporter [Paraburkholderia caballeronis]PXW93451.1 SSS family solute:Na+ symporter [Paraburkholderia caballeronis]RAJ88310.1 SSS family solute:Na+ symporter [Paraburkholderia caballeronis]SEE21509.1 solute:Na+ symporter, SSS family [Paraburkholderia caballeronis]SEM13839.1 solute:Na+ symporter, SSS family [Paraburkholderia caballeronis]
MSSALVIIAAVTLAALWLGMRARRGHDMNLEQWSVGGRSFGTVFVFLLMAGEIYTTFTFLGGSGFAYGKGAPVYYILAYATLAYILSYWMLPPIWRYAKTHRLMSQPHFFTRKYSSPSLGVLVALVDVAALVPYLVLQFKGLGIIVATASYGAISSTTAIWIGAVVVTAYVIVSGVRGCAWNSAVKDVMILAIALFLGIYLPIHHYGSLSEMFRAIDAAKPGFLTFPPRGQGITWFQSTVLLTALGFFMWPHTFGSAFTAKNDRIFRRNAILLPLYQLILLFVFFCGFAAVLKVPGLTGGDIDLSLFLLSLKTFDPWFVGVIGAAGVLTALVPGSMILTSASTLLANDVYRGALNRDADDAKVARLARFFVPVLALVAVAFTLHGGETIVSLLLMGYNFVTQLFPALICSLATRNRATKQGAFCGIVAGVAVVVATTTMHTSIGQLMPFLPDALKDVNIGFLALAVNVVVLAIVSAITQPRTHEEPTHAGAH